MTFRVRPTRVLPKRTVWRTADMNEWMEWARGHYGDFIPHPVFAHGRWLGEFLDYSTEP